MNKIMTAQFVNLNQGFWALIDENNGKYEPINMPEQLKKDGKKSRIWYREFADAESMNMYGSIIKIEGFSVE